MTYFCIHISSPYKEPVYKNIMLLIWLLFVMVAGSLMILIPEKVLPDFFSFVPLDWGTRIVMLNFTFFFLVILYIYDKYIVWGFFANRKNKIRSKEK